MSEDIWARIPNTDDYWINIPDFTNTRHFDVSAYLNARDAWVAELKAEIIEKSELLDKLLDAIEHMPIDLEDFLDE